MQAIMPPGMDMIAALRTGTESRRRLTEPDRSKQRAACGMRLARILAIACLAPSLGFLSAQAVEDRRRAQDHLSSGTDPSLFHGPVKTQDERQEENTLDPPTAEAVPAIPPPDPSIDEAEVGAFMPEDLDPLDDDGSSGTDVGVPGTPIGAMRPLFDSASDGLPTRLDALAEPDAGGASGTPDAKPYWRSNMFKRLGGDVGFYLVHWFPHEVRKPGFAIPFLGTILTASLSRSNGTIAFDRKVGNEIAEDTNGKWDSAARGFTQIGNAVPASLALGAAYLLARRTGHDRLAEASSLSFEAMVDGGLWGEVLKKIAARARPPGESRGEFFQYQPKAGQENGSFPSGHATGAFAVATVFAHVYRAQKWVPWVAYTTAGLIGLSRIAQGRHYPSDVVAGALLGNSLGRMVIARNDGTNKPLALERFQPIFEPAQSRFGVAYTYAW